MAASTSRPKPAPSSGRHKVRAGDTVYSISRRYGVPIRSFIEANRLQAPFRLEVGRRLLLPKPARHRVAKGETIYAIARKYGVSERELVRQNRIPPPYVIREGQELRLPGGGRKKTAAVVVKPLDADKPAGSEATPVTSERSGASSGARPPPRAGRRFAWPMQGRIISRFGAKPGGRYNDGINIEARPGAPVRAADAGVVAYAGNELPGFGNLLLIRHAGGWITAYAHNNDLVVRAGQRVKRGQLIARAGASGGVRRPQLHFELRRGRRAYDPMRYLARTEAGS